MPLDYFAPGVYIEEVDRGSRPIEGVSMSVAGFVGFTEDVRAGAELFKPMLITSWNQYLEYFAKQGSDGYTSFDAYLPFAVHGWFLNGGGRCWIASIGTQLPGMSESNAATVTVPTIGKRPSLRLKLKPESALVEDRRGSPARSPSAGQREGALSTRNPPSALTLFDEPEDERIRVEVTPSEPMPFEGEDEDAPTDNGEFFTLTVKQGEDEVEHYPHLSMNPQIQSEVGTYVVEALAESQFVDVEVLIEKGQPLSKRPANGLYEIAPLMDAMEVNRFSRQLEGVRDDRSGIQGIFEIDDISMVACPDLMRAYQVGILDKDQMHGVMDMMVSLCEQPFPRTSYRMAVLDTPPDVVKPQQVSHWLDNDFGRRSQFAAIYYPWVKVPNPRKGGKPIAIPPCGHMMGVWCRTDEMRGVHKAPANDVPKGVISLAYDVNFREQEFLNPQGINCIRKFPNRGIRIWGARTLVEPDNVQWRYISVRRLVSYIERCLEIGTQWVVFEPNDEDLWARVTRTVGNFLDRLWREGALFGSSAKEAYFVKCDRTLNTAETVMLGRLYIEVGIAPVRPAEFVIFRISQSTAADQDT